MKKILIAIMIALCGLPVLHAEEAKSLADTKVSSERPNILIIYADDMGCTGSA